MLELALTLSLLSGLAQEPASDDPVVCDLVIRQGLVHVGDGSDPVVGDVAVRDDRIVAVGSFPVAGRPREIRADGCMVAPGFIDLHTHSDRSIVNEATRDNANYLLQGVTSILTGNCGSGQLDVAEYLGTIDAQGAGTNVLHWIPHGAVRRQVMQEGAEREATPEEIGAMERLVERSMREGAWGISTGLIYVPGSYATTEELVALARKAGEFDGLYVSHIRNEGTRLLDSVEEAIRIGREAGVPVHISHFKASGEPAWGLASEAIGLIERARDEGLRVTADQYPYVASSTSLAAMVIDAPFRPRDAFQAALENAEREERLREGIARGLRARGNGARLVIASCAAHRDWQGRDLASLAEQEQISVVDLVLKIQQDGGAQMIHFGMNEEEVRLIMRQPFVATASDGSARRPDRNTLPHPRSYGCFPRKIGRYAIERNAITPAHAIRSASGLPAAILGLQDRGLLKAGYAADIVVFDPETFRDTATFEDPHQYATGVRFVWVNGRLAVEEGRVTGTLAGRAIRGPGFRQTRGAGDAPEPLPSEVEAAKGQPIAGSPPP